MELCPSIKNILLLDSEGNRVAVKYYSDDWPTNSAKEAFEKTVYTKTQKTSARNEAEITMFDNYVVVYKFVQDLHFFVTGGENENEIILASVLQEAPWTEGDAGDLDLIFLCLDEIVDAAFDLFASPSLHRTNKFVFLLSFSWFSEYISMAPYHSIVLETDANVIAGKVASHSMDDGAPLSEQTITQALATARERLTRSLLI
ncbi:Coatomer subunit zeta-1 [Hibiscus syriacus]|uniref:Coatomer subunit zeta n=1 Tax=Hibiscus syriacus TaxID=106335 RepID=A0A6A3BSY6_HIBSY|nr:Coatomer subunit zeta-1 [Hibiscus syriacus]